MSTRKQLVEAAQWVFELGGPDADPEKFIEWQKWISADTAHRRAYTAVERQMRLKMMRTQVLPSTREMSADEYDGSCSVEDWLGRQRKKRQGLFTRIALAAGIATLAFAITGLWIVSSYRGQHGSQAYRTAAGERREFELADGSRVTLDAESAFTIEITPELRALRLVRGEAFFNVAKDPSRPFTVRAGNAEVRALGTAFDVRLSVDRTVVAVTEGKVYVTSGGNSPDTPTTSKAFGDSRAGDPTRAKRSARLVRTARVSVGEAIAYVPNVGLLELPPADATLAVGWLKGRRQYRNEALRYVLADLNRYSGQKIALDPSVGDLQFTGTLDLSNRDAWLKGLAVALPVRISETADGEMSIIPR